MASANQIIQVDPTVGSDSDYETHSSRDAYSTQSLSSSIYEYRYENGRRYHAFKSDDYLLPNDETEQDRLDIVHHIYLLLTDGKLHLAPIGPNPQNILDVGTGTGIWAIDIAETYPSAKVIGTDMTPIQPSWVPPNVEFQIDDAELNWTWGKDKFDLIHIRHLAGGIRNWEHVLKEAYRHCKPGGYLEIAEYEMAVGCDDGTCHEGLALWKFYQVVDKAAMLNGRDFRVVKTFKPLMEKAGFVDVVHKPFKIPLGTWPADEKEKKIGAYAALSAESGFEAFGMKLFTNVMGMSFEEAQTLIAETKRNAKDRRVHSYSFHHFYYAQKPLDDEARY